MENVDAILFKENKPHFDRFIIRLNELGYSSSYTVLNAKDFGIPQNRKRCFMVSTLHKGSFIFPTGFPLQLRLKDMLEENVDESFYLSEEQIAKYDRHKERHEAQGHGLGWQPFNPDVERERVGNPVTTRSPRHSNTWIIEQPKSECQGDPGTILWPQGDKDFAVAEPYDGLKVYPKPDIFNSGGTVQKQSTNALNTYKGCGVATVVPSIEIAGNLHQDGRLEHHNRVYDEDGVAPTIFAPHGGDKSPKIEVNPIKTYVRKRKHEVDTEALVSLLREAKSKAKLSNKDIASLTGRPVTEVEHWFRTDSSGSIPDPEVWFDLKEILGIETDSFDAPICEFIEQEGQFEQGQRVHSVEGLCPTLPTQSAVKIEVKGTLGKKTQHYTVYGGGGDRTDIERVRLEGPD